MIVIEKIVGPCQRNPSKGIRNDIIPRIEFITLIQRNPSKGIRNLGLPAGTPSLPSLNPSKGIPQKGLETHHRILGHHTDSTPESNPSKGIRNQRLISWLLPPIQSTSESLKRDQKLQVYLFHYPVVHSLLESLKRDQKLAQQLILPPVVIVQQNPSKGIRNLLCTDILQPPSELRYESLKRDQKL